MKKIWLIICFILFSSVGYAATYHVATTGDNGNGGTSEVDAWQTITYAMATASCGDTILVHAGTYAENAATSKTCASYMTIQAATGESVSVNRFSMNHHYHKIDGFNILTSGGDGVSIGLAVDYIYITNCTFTTQTTAGHYFIDCFSGVGGYDRDHISITNNTFGPTSSATGLDMNIRARGSDFLIENNTFNFVYSSGAAIGMMAKNSVIRGNIFINSNHATATHPDCIQVYIEAGAEITNVTIENNLFLNNNGQVIYTEVHDDGTQVMSDWTVRNNLFINVGAKTIQATGYRFKVHNNTFYLATRNTVHPVGFREGGSPETENSDYSEVINNIFVGCGDSPGTATTGFFNIPSVTGFVHYNNYYADDAANSYGAKTITEDNDVNGGDPLFVNINKWWTLPNDNGDNYDGGSGSGVTTIEVLSSEASRFVVNEFFSIASFGNGADNIARKITDVTGSIVTFTPAVDLTLTEYTTDKYNAMILLWGSQSWGAGDTITPNYRLSSSSTAVDAGYTIVSFNTDYVGTSRPQGASWDIGAYEYQGTSTGSHRGLSIGGGVSIR